MRQRNANGSIIAEGAASTLMIIPFVMVLIAVIVEMASLVLIKQAVTEAARVAARNCALAYHWPPYGTNSQPTGASGSPDAQGDKVAPPMTSAAAPVAVTVNGTSGGARTSNAQPVTANYAFSRVRYTSIVTDNAQFKAVYTPASVNASAQPENQLGHVTVTVTSNPDISPLPDPLKLGQIFPGLRLMSSSTYSL